MITATFDTLVSCIAGMKHTMPSVDSDTTSQPILPTENDGVIGMLKPP